MVCAGLSATKWLANKEPEADDTNIMALQTVLSTVQAKFFVLISTIDIYATTKNVDEANAYSETPTQAYGAHRLAFEQFVRTNFPNYLIVRLPALFGAGLKKNVVFDLLHQHCLANINPQSQFQWYNLKRLWKDIEIAQQAKIDSINLVTEPISTQQLLTKFFSNLSVGQQAAPVAHYNIKTRHAALYHGTHGYIQQQESVLQELGQFIHA